MGKVYFVTGTDTGVGKTYVTYWLAKFIRKRGIPVGCLKPVETGVCDRPEDACLLSKATKQPIDEVVIYTFKNPLSPYAALIEELGTINIEKIKDNINKLASKYELLFVEGAGGIAVPIIKNYTYADLCLELKLPLIVVGRAGLGTINHTFLTWYYAFSRNIKIKAIVLNGFSGNDISEKRNPQIIEEMTGMKPFRLPKNTLPDIETFQPLIEHLL